MSRLSPRLGLPESMLKEKVATIGRNFRRVRPIGGVGVSGLRYRRPSALAQRSFLHGRGAVVSLGATAAGTDLVQVTLRCLVESGAQVAVRQGPAPPSAFECIEAFGTSVLRCAL